MKVPILLTLDRNWVFFCQKQRRKAFSAPNPASGKLCAREKGGTHSSSCHGISQCYILNRGRTHLKRHWTGVSLWRKLYSFLNWYVWGWRGLKKTPDVNLRPPNRYMYIYAHTCVHICHLYSFKHALYNHTHHRNKIICYINIKMFMFSAMRQIFWLCKPENSPGLC